MQEFNNRFEEIYNLEAFIIFLINPFAQIDDDVANKIATYFDISKKEELELEIRNMKNYIELKSHKIAKKHFGNYR